MKAFKSSIQSISVAKQSAMEKMGKATSQVDSEEAKETKDVVNNTKHSYTALQSSMKNCCNESMPLSVAQGEVLADALYSFGNLETDDLSNALKAVGLAQRDMDNSLLTLNTHMKEHFLNPVNTLCDTDLKQCRDLKHKHDAARLKYDAALTDLRNLQKKNDDAKIRKAEESSQAAKAAYEIATSELSEALSRLQERKRTELLQQLREHCNAQIAHLQASMESWQTALTHIADS